MFNYKKTNYEIRDYVDQLYYTVLLKCIGGIFSPFEVCPEIDFPNKDELGGIVVRFIGGGALYFKVQREMPTRDEINSVIEVSEFLKENYGKYVVVRVMCEPHIEIRNINLEDFEDVDVSYTSSRKNDGDELIDELTSKLENNEPWSIQEHILRFNLPFMSRKDEDDFKSKFAKFIQLLDENPIELPLIEDVLTADTAFGHIMGDGAYFIL